MGLSFPGMGVQRELLWQNEASGSSFAAQTVSVKNLSLYQFYCVVFLRVAGNNQQHHVFTSVGRGSECIGQTSYSDLMVREFTSDQNAETVTFSTCHNGPSSVREDFLVPYQIWGIS